jgi:hypothetical protein
LTFKKLESHLTNRETHLTKGEKQKKNTVKKYKFLYLNALLIFGGIPANNSEIRPFFFDLNKHSSNSM